MDKLARIKGMSEEMLDILLAHKQHNDAITKQANFMGGARLLGSSLLGMGKAIPKPALIGAGIGGAMGAGAGLMGENGGVGSAITGGLLGAAGGAALGHGGAHLVKNTPFGQQVLQPNWQAMSAKVRGMMPQPGQVAPAVV